jgi:hypothetical protein
MKLFGLEKLWSGGRGRAEGERPAAYSVGTLTYTKAGVFALFAWLLWGDFCWTMMEAVVPSIMPLKLRALDSPNVLIGFIMTTLGGALNLTVTPYLSYRSDQHRGPLGRRTPFILYTVPFICLTLVLIAYCDPIGRWVNHAFLGGDPARQATCTIVLLAVVVALFDFFNMFVNTVYWYLFVDVVPKPLISRFMSWFRLVGVLAGFLYNFFVFPYAMSHMREIYLGAAALYFVGFGMVCLRVKEGEYPPLTETKRGSIWAQMKTYTRECYRLRYYWDINLHFAIGAMAAAVGVFNIFFLQSLGLDLKVIGRTAALTGAALPVALLFAGELVNRWHAVRVGAYFGACGMFLAFGSWVWLFVTESPPSQLWLWISVASSFFSVIVAAMGQVVEIPRLVELFPRDRYGQFSGAISLIRGPAHMLAGVLSGAFMDIWVLHIFPKEQYGLYGYRFIFLWSAPLSILAFYFQYRVFRVWKRMGGGVNFTPPETPVRLRDLPPRADGDGRVRWGLVALQALGILGGVLGGIVWWWHYTFRTNDHTASVAMLVSWTSSIVLFIAAVRFIKFMERP